MTFQNPYYFLLLLLVIPYILWYVKWRKLGEPSIRISSTKAFEGRGQSGATWRTRLLHAPFILRCLTLVMIICVLARPQTANSWKNTSVEGIDIMLAMDVSTSMLTLDFNPNRMEVAKNVAAEFISGRPNDNIGLTVFAGEAFTQCPMTTDHASLLNLLNNVRTDLAATGIIDDGTAIGMGLANAVGRLKEERKDDGTGNTKGAKSKIVILLTDGSNNRGDISPLTAAEIAKKYGIRVYTIGIGKEGIVNVPMMVGGMVQAMPMKSDIDFKTLQQIASKTNGESYRATNRNELKKIYEDIDKLEKTKFNVRKFDKHYEAYMPFALLALLSFMLELLLRLLVLKRIP